MRDQIQRLLKSDVARACAIHSALLGLTVNFLDGFRAKAILAVAATTLIPVTVLILKWLEGHGQIPSDVMDDIAPLQRYTCIVPAPSSKYNESLALCSLHFTSYCAPSDELKGMYKVNPYSVVILQCDGIVVAYTDFFVLSETALREFRLGSLQETDFTSDMTMPLGRVSEIKSLYMAGIVVQQSKKGEHRTSILIWAVCKVILKKYLMLSNEIFCYAEATTIQGVNLIKSLGFEFCHDKRYRVSSNNLYARTITKKDINNWLASHPDYKTICNLVIN